jgi:hypothetical protein
MEQRYTDALYAVFEGYPLRDKIDACPLLLQHDAVPLVQSRKDIAVSSLRYVCLLLGNGHLRQWQSQPLACPSNASIDKGKIGGNGLCIWILPALRPDVR